MSTHAFQVDGEHQQERLDVYLTRALPDVPSRSFVKKLLDADCVWVNGKQVKAHYKLRINDEIRVEVPEEFLVADHIQPENIALNVFYEDPWLLVIHKPAGMLVHPAPGFTSGTLVNALLYHYKNLSDLNTPLRAGIVHRLDRETSGLLLVAKDNMTHAHLARQFHDHLVKKRYIALVDGEIEFDEGVIDAPLGRHAMHRELRGVLFDDSGKEAVTFYRVLKRHKGMTLVALFPKTGRTHQLRVHLNHLGHPILGDDKYGKKQGFPRLALHAQAIGFQHPQHKCFLEVSCLPPKEFLEKVGL